MRVALLLFALTLLAPGAVLAAGKLYKWTDENGVTHYTDEPPAGQQFETRPVQADPPAAPAAEIAPAVESENCRRTRANVATLEKPGQVRMDIDGDGEAEPLSDLQRNEQLEIARRQVGVYCTVTAPAADEQGQAEDPAGDEAP